MEYGKLFTEGRNPRSMHIDKMSTLEQLQCINAEDHVVVDAVQAALPQIAPVVDRIVSGMKEGGRLIYTGCGTSGRLGVLDASECPPTYGVSSDLVIGVIAGGDHALRNAIEGAEDSREAGIAAMEGLNLQPQDVVVGLSAAGGAAFVLGTLEYAKEKGCATAGITCNPDTPLTRACDMPIVVLSGPEVVTGSTRMKSGTAQKMVLNMLSTGAMIKLGKVYGNLMVDVKPSNEKLVRRCVTIVCAATECDEATATAALEACEYRPKIAIVMVLMGVGAEEAKALLAKADGRIAKVLEK